MILRLGQLPAGPDQQALWPQLPPAPWHLEIGFGDGRFWQAHRLELGPTNYLGVELSGASLLRAHRRLARVERVLLVQASARSLLALAVRPGALQRIYVNFPDPWPKRHHLRHRLLQRDFFTLAASRLAQGGELWLSTDHPEYFTFALGEAQASGCFAARCVPAPEAASQTKYAAKWRALGRTLQHARLRRLPGSYPAPAPHPEGAAVPHSKVRLPSPLRLPESKQVYRSGRSVLILLGCFGNAEGSAFRLFFRSSEPDLEQDLLVKLEAREGGTWLVSLDTFGSPLITPLAHQAVARATELLLAAGGELLLAAY